MSDALDNRTLGVMNVLIAAGLPDAAKVMQQLWKERTLAVDALVHIRDWDLMHAEALSVERAHSIAAETLETVGE